MRENVNNSDVLFKSSVRAGELLGLTHKQLGALLGVSPQAFNDIESYMGEKFNHQAGLLLVELYKQLSAIVGHDQHAIQHWMETKNHRFGQAPMEVAQTATGLERLLAYLESIQR